MNISFDNKMKSRDALDREHKPERLDHEKLITFLNKELKVFLMQYGLEEAQEFTIQDLVIDPEYVQRGGQGATAVYDRNFSKLIIDRLPATEDFEAEAQFLGNITHEMIHGQSFQSIAIHKKQDGLMTLDRRVGVAVNTRTNGVVGEWLNEAITETLNVLFHKHLLTIKEQEGLHPYSREYIRQSDEMVYLSERLLFETLVSALQVNFSEKYPSRESVYRLFFQAALNGRLLPVARLIEQKIGRGYFRSMLSKTHEEVGVLASQMINEQRNSL